MLKDSAWHLLKALPPPLRHRLQNGIEMDPGKLASWDSGLSLPNGA